MKKCVIYFNCHGGIYGKLLRDSPKFKQQYTISYVGIPRYLETSEGCFTPEHLDAFKSADLFICQFISKDRGFLTHTNIINNLIKKDCKIIMLPHFRSSIYEYQSTTDTMKSSISYVIDIPISICNFYDECAGDYQKFKEGFDTINNYKMIKNYEEFIDKCLKEYKTTEDSESTIKTYDFVLENYKKIRLFGHRPYPRLVFFHYVVGQILGSVDIDDLPEYGRYIKDEEAHWNHAIAPIPAYFCKIAGFTFDYKNIKTLIKEHQDFNNIYEYYFGAVKSMFKSVDK